jgi:hypothetical protein
MENLYNSLKVSWKCINTSAVSIGSSTSSARIAYRDLGGVNRIPPDKVPAAPFSSALGLCYGVPATLRAVISLASGRKELTGGGSIIG